MTARIIFITAKNFQRFITHSTDMYKTFIITKTDGRYERRLHKKDNFNTTESNINYINQYYARQKCLASRRLLLRLY